MLLAVLLPLLVGASSTDAAQRPDDPLTPELRAWVQEHGPLRFGGSRTSAPVINVDAEGAVVGGWGVGLVDLLGLKLGIDVEVVVFDDLEETVAALRTGAIDATIPMGQRPDLLAFAQPTEPWSWTPVVFVTADPSILEVGDLDGQTVTTIPNSPLEATLAEDFAAAAYVKADTLPEAVRSVADGEVDLLLAPLAIAGHHLRGLDRTVRVVGNPVRIVEVSAWARSGDPAFDVIATGRDLITDAELRVTHVRWTGFDLTLPPEGEVSPWVWRSLVATLLGGLLAVAFIAVLRRRVALATTALRSLTDELEDRVARQTEQLATANLQLRGSNRALAAFARSVAHDLRGPIAAVGGLAQMVRRGATPPERHDEILDRIIASVERQDQTILRMLANAEAASTADRTLLDGTDLAEWLAEMLGPELEASGATLTTDFPDEAIDADVAVLARTLLNLTGNAIKHGGRGVTIRTSLRLDDDRWVAEVEDDGPGVPPAARDRIFDEGVQLDRRVRGHGFGLHSVRSAVGRVGGTIDVDDGAAGGARFAVTLPRRDSGLPSDA